MGNIEEIRQKLEENYPRQGDTRGAELRSGLADLDLFFSKRGGMSFGRVVEWGAPQGRGSRFLILSFLRSYKGATLWVHSQKNQEGLAPLQVNAPAWAQRGVGLDRLYFLRAKKILPELRPLFLGPSFKFIVLDCPEKLSSGDWSFICAKVRQHKILLFVLRPFFLSQKRGNPLAHWRLNAWLRPGRGKYCVNFLKGGEGKLEFSFELLR